MLRLLGADYSVYVRAVMIALAEKGIPYQLVPIDVFKENGLPKSYLDRQPFGKIPALEHNNFHLYETTAILQYVDEIFDGPRLQPTAPTVRARMTQIQSILNNYAYQTLVWDLYVPGIEEAGDGEPGDKRKVSAALPVAQTILTALEDLADQEGPYLLGSDFSLADCLASPMFDLFCKTTESGQLMAHTSKLKAWWRQVSNRQSVLNTKPREPEL